MEGYFIEHKSRNSSLFQPTDSSAGGFREIPREADYQDAFLVLLELAPRSGVNTHNTLTPETLFFRCRKVLAFGGAAAKTTVKIGGWVFVGDECHLLSRMSRKKVADAAGDKTY
ncbi:phage terminase large subunit family protein [Salmonella enterica subsp. enterica]|nr:phage terminase large subunit family protein [Salmonella enterica subsp. enterica]